MWARRKTLLLADLHLGKAATFIGQGIPVPMAVMQTDLDRLTLLIHRFNIQRVVFLGDLMHSKNGRCTTTMSLIEVWRENHPELDVLLIRGNHDRHAGDPPPHWQIGRAFV